jgi:hypothetical protein
MPRERQMVLEYIEVVQEQNIFNSHKACVDSHLVRLYQKVLFQISVSSAIKPVTTAEMLHDSSRSPPPYARLRHQSVVYPKSSPGFLFLLHL